ncbi:MAG: ABC transporter ATP-binding protein/permease [Clostridiales bacterium]|jgi:ABC-type lipoprotein export system ATPase subunit/ABC-type antimicrobial peptide transport system permease subunit|nr:ABC transporter ATP-binding protein/permease [Clostridiales bacterium]
MLSIRNLTKLYYPKRGNAVTALNNINLDIADSGLVFLLGKSGSGKSSLLNIIGGLDTYTNGEIIIKNKSSSGFSKADFDSYRNTFLGFIFQEYYLLEDYTVGKNISLALELQRKKADKDAVVDMLARVDLSEDYYNRKINELSGGQKQRVSIARALVKNPDIILADEPTGALDTKTGLQVFDVLRNLAKQKLIIVVSHDRENAELYADRIIELADGNVISDRTRSTDNGQLQDTPPINWISDNLVQIQPGYQLQSQDVDRINSMLRNNNQVAYISQDAKSNLVFGEKASVHGLSGTFEGTNPSNLHIKQYNPSDFALVRSHLPFKDSFKIGASGLKTKPIRLTFLLILSLVAFTMFGMSFTGSFVNSVQMEVNYLRDRNRQSLVVSNQHGYRYIDDSISWSYSDQPIRSEHLQELTKITGKTPLKILSNYSVNIGDYSDRNLILESGERDNYFAPIQSISTLLELPQEGTPGFLRLVEGQQPQDYDEIAVSDWIADYFVGHNYIGQEQPKAINSYKDLVGLELRLDNTLLTISGVYATDTDLSKFGNVNAKDNDNFLNKIMFESLNGNTAGSMMYVKSGFGTQQQPSIVTIPRKANSYLNNSVSYGRYIYYLLANNASPVESREVYLKDGVDIDNLADNQILLGGRYFGIDYNTPSETAQSIFDSLVQPGGELDSPFEYTLVLYDEDGSYQPYSEIFEVVGLLCNIEADNYWENEALSEAMILNPNALAKLSDLIATISTNDSSVMLDVSNTSTMRAVYKYLANSVIEIGEDLFALTPNTEFGVIRMFAQLFEGAFTPVLLWIGIVLAIFSALLFMNFIGVSIYHKKKQIGILRAIGARGRDVFKIFFIEGLLISLGIFVLSSIATTLLCWLINISIGFAVLNVNVFVFAGLLGVAVLVALLATWLPVFKITIKKPIDAINNK